MLKSVKRIIALAAFAGVAIIGGSIGLGLGLNSMKTYPIEIESAMENVEFEGEGQYKIGQEVTLEASDVQDYRFVGWKFKNKVISNENPYTFTLKSDNIGTYTAVYEKEYNVSVSQLENGQVVASVTKAIKDEVVTLDITPSENYVLSTLYYKVVGDETNAEHEITNNSFIMPAGNVEIYATFERQYNVTKGATTNGELNVSLQKVVVGEEVTLTITPNPNYELVKVYYVKENDQSQNRNIIYNLKFNMPEDNVTVYAEFDFIKYNITVDETENGTVNLSATKGKVGDTIELTITPDEDYEIDKVYYSYGDNDPVEILDDDGYRFTMPEGSVTVNVTFKSIQN